MICRFDNLRRYQSVFLKMTGLRLNEFADLLDDMLPRLAEAQQARLQRPNRQRAIGGGRHADLLPRDQILLTVIWLRLYPTNEVLGFLFGVSDSTVSRLVKRIVPLLEASGKDTMRLPDPGRKHRKELDALLKETPELAVIIDTFEQRVQRCKDRKQADEHYSGKKKQHTLNVCFNQAFAKRRIKVEHTIGRMRRYQSLSQCETPMPDAAYSQNAELAKPNSQLGHDR
jgi:hypothetical protein